MILKLDVPISTGCPKITFSEIPLRWSLSEKTAAPNRIYAVSSQLAFLSTEISLTRLIPLRLTGVMNPLIDIQSVSTDKCLWFT